MNGLPALLLPNTPATGTDNPSVEEIFESVVDADAGATAAPRFARSAPKSRDASACSLAAAARCSRRADISRWESRIAAKGPHTLLVRAALKAGSSDVDTDAAAAWNGAMPAPDDSRESGSTASESCRSAPANWSLAACTATAAALAAWRLRL